MNTVFLSRELFAVWLLWELHIQFFILHLSSEPGGQSSRVRASKADPGVPVAQIETLADELVENSQVSQPGLRKTHQNRKQL